MEKTKVKKKRSLFHKIVNVFIGIFIGLLVLVVIAIGFTQTKTFREILRKQVISRVNASLNGKLYIERIDGSILTSITIHNASITLDQDTILYAKKIDVLTSPLDLLFNKIHVRYFELSNTSISLFKDTTGVLNISRLVKPTAEDTLKSEFPYKIQIDDLQLKNIKLRMASFENRNSTATYTKFTTDDLRLDSFYLSLNAFADIKGKEFELAINHISSKTNFNGFWLKTFKGKFELDSEHAKISNFYFATNTTDFDLNASLDKVNLFNNFSLEKLKNSPVSVKLNVRVFDFTDLSTYISATDFMKGTVKTTLDASGTYGDLDIITLSLDYLQTHLDLKGNIKNLHEPQDMYIKAKISNGQIVYKNINELLPLMQLPKYDLKLTDLETEYEGKVTNFKANLKAGLNEGKISADTKFNFDSTEMSYDVNLLTSKLDLQPVINSKTNLNSKISVKGSGTKISRMNTLVAIDIASSTFQNYKIDTLHSTVNAHNGNVLLALNSIAHQSGINLQGQLNFNDEENPSYNIDGKISKLDLNKLVMDTTMSSDLNLTFNIKGKSFEPKKMDSQFKLLIANSVYNKVKIDSTELNLKYTWLNNKRLISLVSDFADLNITGNYDIEKAVSVIEYESKIISNSVMEKIHEINPMALFNDSIKIKEFKYQRKLEEKIPDFVNNEFDLKYDLTIKDFGLIARIAGIEDISVVGAINGDVSNNGQTFAASTNLNFDKIRLRNPDVYISKLALDLSVNRDNKSVRFSNINAELKYSTERVFSGTDLKNINLNFKLKNDVLDYNIAADVDTTAHAEIAGLTDMTEYQLKFDVSKLLLRYLDYEWKNDSDLVATYNKDVFEVQKFRLVRNGSSIDLTGRVFGDGKENMKLKIEDLDMELINRLAGLSSNMLSANINMDMLLNGYLHDPVINLTLDIDSIKSNKINFGRMQSKFDYKNLVLNTDVQFIDSTGNTTSPTLILSGQLPVNLAFVGAKERIPAGKTIDLSLKSNNFDLSTFAPFVPFVRNVSGKLESDLKLGGTTDNINHSGKFSIVDGSFTAVQNNLTYGLNINIGLEQEALIIENLKLQNTGGTNYKGTLSGSGRVNFKGFNVETIDATINGDLAVLSEASKSAVPFLYGDLIIVSDGDWKFTNSEGNSNFTGNVLLRDVDLTVPQFQTAYGGASDYVYIYRRDSTTIDKKQEEFKQFVALSKKYNPKKEEKESSFNYNVKIKVEDEAKVTVILNQESNQYLLAVLNGECLFRSGGVAQGQFELLEDSELKFIKTFQATGNIYFERDPSNPRLNITATYIGDHYELGDSLNSEPKPVAVKIKLDGSVDKLGENLASSEDNIAVYEGEKNIDDNVPSPDKNTADAMSFIITGKFVDELTATDKTSKGSMLGGYTTSVLGGLLSGFANSQFGDVVRNIELENRGNTTRFSLSGRVKNFRYTFGSNTDDFEDISKANIRFEYPFSSSLLVRFERKDPLLEKATNAEKVNEVALKYKFEF